MTAAVIVAAGKGTRMGGAENKLRIAVDGKSIAERTIERFFRHPRVGAVVVVRARRDEGFFADLNAARFEGKLFFAEGGDTRSASVRNGLAACPAGTEIVLIHDGARPFAEDDLISRCIDSAERYGSGIAAIPATDTVGLREGEEFTGQAERDKLALLQTPQAFRYAEIVEAYQALDVNASPTDDSGVYLAAGKRPRIVPGSAENVKITYPADLRRLQGQARESRVGTGADAHRFAEGRKLILGGVEIPYFAGLLGHSDADALTHAVMDALLSAAHLPDIGALFPDSDPAYAGASSVGLLERVREKLAGCRVVNVSAVVICQRPKLAGHLAAMERNLAEALRIAPARVKVSATTTEGMGFAGRGEGIAATATALIEVPVTEEE